MGEVITEQDKYNGVRLFIETEFDSIRQRLQIDLGFGDVVTPANQQLEYPILLEEMQAPIIQAYSKEPVIAEKFQAMIELSLLNSRMKDFYDVYKLLSTEDFNSELLHEAIIATFNNRETSYTENHALFTAEFASNAQRQRNWTAFLNKIKRDRHLTFEVIIELIIERLMPYWKGIRKDS